MVLLNGTQWTRDDPEGVEEIISLVSQYSMIADLEVHDATGKDAFSSLDAAVDYWISIKDALVGKEDRVIVNKASEWKLECQRVRSQRKSRQLTSIW